MVDSIDNTKSLEKSLDAPDKKSTTAKEKVDKNNIAKTPDPALKKKKGSKTPTEHLPTMEEAEAEIAQLFQKGMSRPAKDIISDSVRKREFNFSSIKSIFRKGETTVSKTPAWFTRNVTMSGIMKLHNFQKNVQSTYMQKSISLAFKRTSFLKSINSSLKSIAHILNRKTDAIKVNTGKTASSMIKMEASSSMGNSLLGGFIKSYFIDAGKDILTSIFKGKHLIDIAKDYQKAGLKKIIDARKTAYSFVDKDKFLGKTARWGTGVAGKIINNLPGKSLLHKEGYLQKGVGYAKSFAEFFAPDWIKSNLNLDVNAPGGVSNVVSPQTAQQTFLENWKKEQLDLLTEIRDRRAVNDNTTDGRFRRSTRGDFTSKLSEGNETPFLNGKRRRVNKKATADKEVLKTRLRESLESRRRYAAEKEVLENTIPPEELIPYKNRVSKKDRRARISRYLKDRKKRLPKNVEKAVETPVEEPVVHSTETVTPTSEMTSKSKETKSDVYTTEPPIESRTSRRSRSSILKKSVKDLLNGDSRRAKAAVGTATKSLLSRGKALGAGGIAAAMGAYHAATVRHKKTVDPEEALKQREAVQRQKEEAFTKRHDETVKRTTERIKESNEKYGHDWDYDPNQKSILSKLWDYFSDNSGDISSHDKKPSKKSSRRDKASTRRTRRSASPRRTGRIRSSVGKRGALRTGARVVGRAGAFGAKTGVKTVKTAGKAALLVGKGHLKVGKLAFKAGKGALKGGFGLGRLAFKNRRLLGGLAKGGAIGLAGTAAIGLADNFIDSHTKSGGTLNTIGHTLTGAGNGALIGAEIGSLFPGIGTAVGAGVGAIIGAAWSNKDAIIHLGKSIGHGFASAGEFLGKGFNYISDSLFGKDSKILSNGKFLLGALGPMGMLVSGLSVIGKKIGIFGKAEAADIDQSKVKTISSDDIFSGTNTSNFTASNDNTTSYSGGSSFNKKSIVANRSIDEDSAYKDSFGKLNKDIQNRITNSKNEALKYTLWTTAQQFGSKQAADIFNNVSKERPDMSDDDFIKGVYEIRATSIGKGDRGAFTNRAQAALTNANQLEVTRNIVSGKQATDYASLSKTIGDTSSNSTVANQIDNIDMERLAGAVAMAESGGDPKAVSGVGAQGLMQFMPATYRGLGGKNPFDPQEAWGLGKKYLSQLLTQFQDLPKALAAYNWGPGALAKDIRKLGPAWRNELPPETSKYISKVTNNYRTGNVVRLEDVLQHKGGKTRDSSGTDGNTNVAQSTQTSSSTLGGLVSKANADTRPLLPNGRDSTTIVHKATPATAESTPNTPPPPEVISRVISSPPPPEVKKNIVATGPASTNDKSNPDISKHTELTAKNSDATVTLLTDIKDLLAKQAELNISKGSTAAAPTIINNSQTHVVNSNQDTLSFSNGRDRYSHIR